MRIKYLIAEVIIIRCKRLVWSSGVFNLVLSTEEAQSMLVEPVSDMGRESRSFPPGVGMLMGVTLDSECVQMFKLPNFNDFLIRG